MTSAEINEMRKRYQEELLAERDRIVPLLEKRGITKAKVRPFDRVVTIDYPEDYSRIGHTCFQVPEDIDLKKVVRWFVHDTKFHECTVFLSGWNPTTVRCDRDIDYYFKYAPAAHERYLAEERDAK